MEELKAINPIIPLDYPDPDIIRVGKTYYMVSTTMYFLPGCEILRSYDLVNWEHACFVYDQLDSTEAQRLVGNQNIYGKGMWAASLRYHKGTFYVVFAANDTRKTYLYTTTDINKPWVKKEIKDFYHDASLFFDDDERVYIIYGNSDIWLTELDKDLSGPKKNGTHKIIVSEKNLILGYEGAHFYKINDHYYVFLIHSLPDKWMCTQACYMAKSLDDEFIGKDILCDDRGYFNQGVAQGGIVDTPEGDWYAILFQDHGAVGRLPILTLIRWENNFPVIGHNGSIPSEFTVKSTKSDYDYTPLYGSDDFTSENDTIHGLKPFWQFNHEPNMKGYHHNPDEGYIELTNQTTAATFTQVQNMLTQRMLFPRCSAEVTIDASLLKEGDIAGIAALQSQYGFVGIRKLNGTYSIEFHSAMNKGHNKALNNERIKVNNESVILKIEVSFENQKDTARFYYHNKEKFIQIGQEHHLKYNLEHFTGYRFALFNWGTEMTGGSARFSELKYSH
ncbi:glycoside hydrolase family 43 protein [Alkalibacterium iburiense]|uniref:Glycoside hydrolase family 43 protein n=1 Tax=Alkalibacterium iburiense TaxID=290589 RepID=A0ABN0XR88_9LACT